MKVQARSNGSIELAVTKRERDGILAMGRQIILRMDAAEICLMLGFDKQEVVEFLTRLDSLVPLPANITGIDYSLALSRDHICLLLAILRESYQELGQREFVASTGIPLDLWRSWMNYMVEVKRETEAG